jgi:hypothetical protein
MSAAISVKSAAKGMVKKLDSEFAMAARQAGNCSAWCCRV